MKIRSLSISPLACKLGILQRPSKASQLKTGPSGDRDHAERGDVRGWVMITLASAVLVAALLVLGGPALDELFNLGS